MGLWSRFFRWRSDDAAPPPSADAPDADTTAEQDAHTIPLPSAPFVFECQLCGKVFEARRRRPQCPECDSPEVSIISE